ncbi:hypothetical protein KC19_10G125100 [Ceratodon purpureus]|uniref:EamA domain-containing protein n=1 Tax=Ceratodon purpureus TaxID=3225 RepID=A0A8T0GMB5_CERPU|nr:hypothetical protein KC19_10G125100 [Ceratodon purpureus]
MLTRRPSLHFGAIDQSPPLCTEFVGSHRIQRHKSNHGDGNDRRIDNGRSAIQASHIPGGRKGRASLAYVRGLSMKGLKAGSQQSTKDSVSRSVIDATVERMPVIPYSDLVLRRKLDGGHSLIEATESGSENEYCWEDAWKLYMQSQSVTLKELAARVQECNPQVESASSRPEPETLPQKYSDSSDQQERAESTVIDEAQCGDAQEKQPSFLSKLRAEILGRRRTSGLILLNVLAALYGSSTVAGKFATDVAPGLPASLSSLVRFSSALVVFLPALRNVLGRDDNSALLKAGAELGGLLFAAAILETCGNGGASSDAPLLFAFTVIFVPIMELCAGRQSVRNITRIASLVALSGMGVLEEEGLGWKGISLPQVGDVWGLAASAIYALHIFRSEAHSKSFKPFELTAIQCGTVASLSLVWEISRVLHGNTTAIEYVSQLQSLPWGPLVYTGLVCSGLCSWLEIHGLRSVHASTATMVNTTIPIWGAFLSFFLRGETLDDSAIVGGTVILVASLFAQLVSKQDDTISPRPASEEPKDSQPPELPSNSSTPNPNPTADHVQGAIITSQLKFPYYAAQAKRLLVEAKFKLLSVKSLVMSATSTLLTSTPPIPSGSLHSAAAPSAIATSVTLQQAANVVNNSGVTSSSPSGAHAAVIFQWLDVAAGVLESAITALGSDMVQAVEEAEDIAKLLEQGTQTAMDHMAMAATSLDSLLVSLDMANWASLEFLKSVDTTTTSAVMDSALPLISHNADAVLQILLNCISTPN